MRRILIVAFIFIASCALSQNLGPSCNAWQGKFRITFINEVVLEKNCLMPSYYHVRKFLIRREDTKEMTRIKYEQIKYIELLNPQQIIRDDAFQNASEKAYSTKAIVKAEALDGRILVLKGDIGAGHWTYFNEFGEPSVFFLGNMDRNTKGPYLLKLEVFE